MRNRRKFSLMIAVVLCLFGLGMAPSAMADAIYWENVDTGQTVTQLSLLKGQDPADTATIRLKAEIPAGKTLKAYDIKWNYDPAKIKVNSAVAAPGSAFPPAVVGTATAGLVTFNGFSIAGVPGAATVALIDVQIEGVSQGCAQSTLTVTDFGSSVTDQFKPTPSDLTICVAGAATKLVFDSSALNQAAGDKGMLTVTLQDADDFAAPATADLSVSLSSDSPKGAFFDTSDNSITAVTIPAGSSSAQFKYADETAGTPTITVSATGLTAATQQQTITAGALAALTVVANPSTLKAGETAALTATGADQFGNNVADIGTITWDSTFGTVTASGPDSATFESTVANAGTVTATSSIGGISGTSGTITVGPDVLAQLTVSPETANLSAGEKQTFQVTGEDGFGNPVTALGTITWSGGAGIGTIVPASGEFTATTAGTGTVTATSDIGNVSASSGTITVAPGALATVAITPEGEVNLTADDTQQFTVAGEDAYGNSIDTLPAATWAVTGGIGTIGANGLFEATTVGAGTVSVTVGALSATSGAINVSPGAPAEILLVSDKNKVASGGKGSTVLTATFKDADGNLVETDSGTTVTFTATGAGEIHVNPNPATGDTTNGVATATVGTTGTVAAPGSALASIVATAGTLTSNAVELTIVNFSIDVADNQTSLIRRPFTPSAVALSGQGGLSGQYRWTIAGIGSFSATETVTAVVADNPTFYAPETLTGASQTVTIRLEDTGDPVNLNDQVVLTVHNPTKLVFTSAPLNQAAGVDGTMTVEVQAEDETPVTVGAFDVALSSDSTGKFYKTNPGTEITSVTIADGASSASFNYKDEKAGTPTVSASINGLTAAVQQQTIVPAAAAKMTLEASKTTLASGGKGSAELTARIFDAFDNLVTTDDTTQIVFTATPDTYLAVIGSPATVADGVAKATVTTKGGAVPSPPASAQVSIASGALAAPAPVALTIVNFAIQAAGDARLLVSGNTPDSMVLTGTGGTTGNYRWALDGVGSLSATNTDSVTYSAPESITGESQTATVTLRDATDASLIDTVAITVFSKVAITDKPTTPPIIEAGDTSATFSVGGGDDALYTWTLTDGAGTVVDTQTGGSYSFVAPAAGAFAGVYTVAVADNNGFTDSFEVKVPINLDPAAKAFTVTKLDGAANPQIFTVSGARSDYVWEILDETEVAAEGTYGTWAKMSPVAGDPTNTLTPSDVDGVKQFLIRVTVQNDADLTEENGLNQRVFGPFTLIPVSSYEVTVTDEAGAAIEGGTVSAHYTDPSTGFNVPDQTTGAEGKALFTLPDAGGTYAYTASAAGYISDTISSSAKALTLALDTKGTDVITGTVTDGSAALADATVTAYQPADLTKTYSDTTAADGTYNISLPVGAAQSGWIVVAELDGYTSAAKTDQSIGTPANFVLEETADDVAPGSVTLNQDGQTIKVNVPATGVTRNAFIIVNPLPKSGSGPAAATQGSPVYVYEVRLDVTIGGSRLTDEEINRVEITLPIDLRVVGPGDLENGVYVIYKGESLTQIEAGNGEPVPVSQIISTDYVGDGALGAVTFWVDSLSVFAIGSPDEEETPLSGGGGSSGCFIATAAYGSPYESHVSLLRQFRDVYLLPHQLGQAFVKAYYRYSPPMADFIAEHDSLRAAVRVGLLPLVGFSYLLIHFGALGTLAALMAGLLLVAFGVARIRRNC